MCNATMARFLSRASNRAVRDHAKDGKDLHLFESLGKGKGYRYVGRFACATWEYRQGVDRKGNQRRVIVFHLLSSDEGRPEDGTAAPSFVGEPIDRLRQRALDAASEADERKPREAKGLYHKRSAVVRAYVLRRAAGTCESCGKTAPFKRVDGTPYLEPHHTRRIPDGGPDHPRWVGAVCPNCHREMHHGADGEEKNELLQQHLAVLENE